MEALKTRTAFYPGCSLQGTASGFRMSLLQVLRALDMECPVLRDWNCCGATSAHAMDENLYLALNTRNLALAEQQGYDEILAPCAACYHRLASTQFELRSHPNLLQRMNRDAGLTYRGTVKVRNLLDFLDHVVTPDQIRARVISPLYGLRVACYYGCLNTRIPRMEPFDDRECPQAMDHVIHAVGGVPIRWSYKTECCGGSLFLSTESVSARLASKILKDAVARKADCIAVACPLCHNNLDTKQDEIREQFGIPRPVPILFVTQLIGLAFGLGAPALGLPQNFVPFVRKSPGADEGS
jgi:heterodisulfide reductase subunit B